MQQGLKLLAMRTRTLIGHVGRHFIFFWFAPSPRSWGAVGKWRPSRAGIWPQETQRGTRSEAKPEDEAEYGQGKRKAPPERGKGI